MAVYLFSFIVEADNPDEAAEIMAERAVRGARDMDLDYEVLED